MLNSTTHVKWLLATAALLLLGTGCSDSPKVIPLLPVSESAQSERPVNSALEVPGKADRVSGKVIAVTDGDTIKVWRDQEQITVRLEGIDSPEMNQRFGEMAKDAVAELCLGKEVTLTVTGKDKYGRTLADVLLAEGTSVNQEMVRIGFAWWFRKYSVDETLKALEEEARNNKRGLWADAGPIAPWDWRAAQRGRQSPPVVETEVVPGSLKIVALLPNPTGADEGKEQVTLENRAGEEVDLSGWKLADKAGNAYLLSGSVAPGKQLVITMNPPTMPLNNNGETVVLADAGGVVRDRVTYAGSQVRSGAIVRFEN